MVKMFPKTFNPPLEKEKKSFPNFFKILVKVLVIVIIFVGLGYLIFHSSFFKIKNIQLENSVPHEAENILAKFKDTNIFLINKSTIKEELLNQYPDLANISIQRGLPDTLKISGDFYQGQIVWKSQNHSYLVNNNGIVFKEFDGTTDLPIVQDSKNLPIELKTQVVSANFINFIREIYNKFSDALGFKIVYFEINETIFQVDAMTDQGWYVKFDTTRSVDDQLVALKQLLSAHKDEIHEYADVRVEGKVFYK